MAIRNGEKNNVKNIEYNEVIEMKEIIIGIFGLCLIGAIEFYALSKGINGIAMATSIGAIFGIICGICGWKIAKIKDHMDFIRGKKIWVQKLKKMAYVILCQDVWL